MYLTFVSYYLIMFPVSIALIFYVGQHMDYEADILKEGMGIRGFSLGPIIGLIFQICGYLYMFLCHINYE